jgi:hypothetical protein
LTRRLLALVSFAVLAACNGASGPPPPVSLATPSPATDDLQPLSSREAPAASASSPALPPGHPPIAGRGPHGNLAPAGPGRSAGSVTGTVRLAPGLTVGSSDVLYLIAKRQGATIAARRVDRPRFPFRFEISGADAMMAGIGFEGPVDLVARVSRTGDAIPSKGDLEGTARGVAVPAAGVSITIDTVRQ